MNIFPSKVLLATDGSEEANLAASRAAEQAQASPDSEAQRGWWRRVSGDR